MIPQLEGVPPFRGFALQVRFSSNNGLAGEFSWDEEEVKAHFYTVKCRLKGLARNLVQFRLIRCKCAFNTILTVPP